MSARSIVHSNIEGVTFGVEIETTIPRNLIPVGGYHAGVPVQHPLAPTYAGVPWKAERDGSISVRRRGQQACEFVSPILRGESGVQHLLAFVAWLQSVGAEVNPSCGLHIHIGVAAFTSENNEQRADFIARLSRLTTQNATALYAQTGTLKREQGMFCQKPGSVYRNAVNKAARDKNPQIAAAGVTRYHLLNLANLNRLGTVEFRCFAGTTNAHKILLHLFSVLCLCRVAANCKSFPAWEKGELTGTAALRNFLKVRPMWQVIATQTFADHKTAMLTKAFELAAKYDAAKAALAPVLATTLNQ